MRGFCHNAAADTRKPFGGEPRDGDLAPVLWRCPTHTQLIRLTSFPAKFFAAKKTLENIPRHER